jgi:hypothetical protein
MSRLPRGRCPVCRADVALRKGGLVRQHKAPDDERDVPRDEFGWCAGSGRLEAGADGQLPGQLTIEETG